MSVHMVVESKSGSPMDDWDDGLACRPYPAIYDSVPHETDEIGDPADWRSLEGRIRLTDIAAARAAIECAEDPPNKDLHLALMDRLEREPNWWIRFSY